MVACEAYDASVRSSYAWIARCDHWTPSKDWRNGVPFILQDGYTAPEFAQAVRADRLRQDRGGTGPIDADGKTPFDLTKAWPVMISPGRYRWETVSGTVRNAKGGDYITSVEPRL